MKIKKFLSSCLLVALAMVSLQASANNINANSARTVANSFIKQHAASIHAFRSASLADLKLVHAETSSAVSNANAYYAFNIKGGGFIIVSGEDRANQVLGYSDRGHLDFNNLPDNFKALLGSYKEEIEYLQAHPQLDVTPDIRSTSGVVVKPLITAIWALLSAMSCLSERILRRGMYRHSDEPSHVLLEIPDHKSLAEFLLLL